MGSGEPAPPCTPPTQKSRREDSPAGFSTAIRPSWDERVSRVSATRVRDTPISPIPLELGAAKKSVTIAQPKASGPSAHAAPALAPASTSQPVAKKGPLETALSRAIQDAKTQAAQREEVLREIAGAIDPLAQKLRGQKLRFFQAVQANILAVCQAALVGGGGQGPPPPPPPPQVTGPKSTGARARTVSRGRSRGRTPSQPSAAPTTYAEVAAAQPDLRPAPKPVAQPARAPAASKDQRLLVRIGQDSPARSHHPWAVTTALRGKFGNHVKEVRRIPTGFAIVPRNKASREALLEQREAIKATLGGAVEVPSEQHSYFVSRVPVAVHDLLMRRVQVTEESVAQEAEATTGVAPTRVTATRDTSQPTRNYIVVFPKKVGTFHLYGSSGPSRVMKDKPRILQCTNCWDYHDTRACRSLAKCRVCGSEACNRLGSCDHTQCAVCHGPHQADSETCPLRPSIRYGAIVRPTRNQRTAVRRANDKVREVRLEAAAAASQPSQTPAVQAAPTPCLSRSRTAAITISVPTSRGPDTESSPL